MIVGVIMALAALEVSIGPLLAVVGAAGFVIAFALQDSLSNFASGLMILFFRPFDVGDVVDAGGVSGKVTSMNLVSTTIKTFDNKDMLVPNNKIWNDVITNATGVDTRRVDMEFGIGYDDDVDRAQTILEEIVAAHPKALKDPAPLFGGNRAERKSTLLALRPRLPATKKDRRKLLMRFFAPPAALVRCLFCLVSILRAQSRVGSSAEDKYGASAVVSDPFTIVTGSPTRVDTKSCRAVPRGTRMHPWEAGWGGTTPSCRPTAPALRRRK